MSTSKFKQTEIGIIPEDWEVVRLGDEDVADIIMEQSPPSSTCNQEGIGLPFLQGNAEFGGTYPAPILWCSQPIKIAEKNDILLSVRAEKLERVKRGLMNYLLNGRKRVEI
jgi:type I restriction enzyme S subunit